MGKLSCDCDVIHIEVVEKAKSELLKDKTLEKMALFYKAMGDKTRIKILCLLSKAELCVCDISNLLNMTKSAVSHQLKYLKDMKLIKNRKQGKEIWYSLNDEHVEIVFNLALEHVLEGNDEKEI